VLVSAQDYRLGFNIGFQQVRTDRGILRVSQVPFSIHLDAAYCFSKELSFHLEIGRTMYTEFTGMEFGLNGKYTFFSPLYITGGLLLHLNEGTDIGLVDRTKYATILMFYPGIGITIIPSVLIELNYYIPASHPQIYSTLDWITFENISKKFKSMIRLNFIFTWKI
jgi:hypothetical protein